MPSQTDVQAILREAERRAVRMIEDGQPLPATLAHLATAAEATSAGRTVVSILVLDRDGLLRNGASPNLPADYLDAIDRLRPDPGVGTCAAAAATGEIVLTPSFLDDERWSELRHLPLALGFHGAWSMPIKSAQGAVLGTFGTYFRECRQPSELEREVVGRLAPLAARAIASH